MSLDLTDDRSTLVQVMTWCRQATSHYLSRCWPRSLASLGLNVLNPLTKSSIIQSISCLLMSWLLVSPGHRQQGTVFLNTLRPRQNGRQFADDVFKCNLLKENVWIPIKISLKFVPKGPSNNIPALVHIMAWRRQGDKPLSEPMMGRLPTHICVTRPQWVMSLRKCWYKVLFRVDGFNSLFPKRNISASNFESVRFKAYHVLKWPCGEILHDFTDDKSILVQVMAWCHQVTSHYQS